MGIEKHFDDSKVALLLLADEMTFRDVQRNLEIFFQQSLRFSEVHLIAAEKYTNENELRNQHGIFQIHTVGACDETSPDWFRDILHNSKCGQMILATGNAVWKSKYSLEHHCLQARVSGKGVSVCDDASLKMECLENKSVFGCVDSFVFSTQWLLDNEICLEGISETEQSLFIADVVAAADDREEVLNIVKGKDFSTRAQKWARSLT